MENVNEMMNVSEQEMLTLWRRVMHLDPVRRECTVERDDGIDVDALLLIHLRQWYAHLLVTAPLEWVPIEDVRAQVDVSADQQGVVTAVLPSCAVRPVEWQLAGWDHSVTTFVDPHTPLARRQLNMWTRSGTMDPAAVWHPGRLTLYSLPAGVSPVLLLARCVAAPEQNRYVFHQSALETLPRWNL